MVQMKEPIIFEDATLLDAISVIEKTTKRIAVVLTKDKKLMGTITDGDIRRYILSDGKLTDLATKAMNSFPVTCFAEETDIQILDKMRLNNVIAIPLLDEKSKFTKIIHLQDIVNSNKNISNQDTKFECAVILAGGKGSRLLPYTKDLPKPMLEIGGIPIIERQIRSLKAAGVRNIYISVNYLKNIIMDYFEDGTKFDVNITYLIDNSLGTSGPLSNLKISPNQEVLVLNGDIYTTINYTNLWDFYKKSNSDIIVAAVEHQVTIPFGLLKTNEQNVLEISEKPTLRYLCNAGIYVLKSKVIENIPKNRFSNMTDVINKNILLGNKVNAFPIYESWVDIGTVDQLEKARLYFINREITE